MRVSLCEVSGVMVSQCEKRCPSVMVSWCPSVRVSQCDDVLVFLCKSVSV